MIKTYLLSIVLFLLTYPLLSQSLTYPAEMVVTKSELENQYYHKDSSANAVVLFEVGNTYVDEKSFNLITEVIKKVKVFSDEGLEYGTVKIPLLKNSTDQQKIQDLKGSTFNLVDEEIQRTNLEEKGIFKEDVNSQFNLLSFTFPNLKKGSIITYSYKLESPFFYKYYGWEFQDEIPKVHSEYHTRIPGNWSYHLRLVGNLKLDDQQQSVEKNCLKIRVGTNADCTKSLYVMKDIPAMRDEGFVTTTRNYQSRLDYELKSITNLQGITDNVTKTWKITDNEIKTETDLGRQLRRSGLVKDVLPAPISAMPNNLEKAQKIYEYVQDNYSYNEEYKMFEDVSLKSLLEDKTGSRPELAILLHNLLDEEGFEVYPVLSSTRGDGFITKLYPVISDFTYIMINLQLNDKSYLLDTSNKFLAFGEIPFTTLNSYGRQLNFKNESKWFDILPSKKTYAQFRALLEIDSTKTISGILKARKSGYHALESRQAYYQNNEYYRQSISDNYINPKLYEHKVVNGDKRSSVFQEEFTVDYKPDIISEKVLLNPFVYSIFKTNPFISKTRSFPIDFGHSDSYYYTAILNLNSQYEVESLPEEFNLSLPQNKGSLVFTTKHINDSIEIALKFNFKDSLYSPEYYPYIKKFMASLIDVQKNSIIVLKKK